MDGHESSCFFRASDFLCIIHLSVQVTSISFESHWRLRSASMPLLLGDRPFPLNVLGLDGIPPPDSHITP